MLRTFILFVLIFLLGTSLYHAVPQASREKHGRENIPPLFEAPLEPPSPPAQHPPSPSRLNPESLSKDSLKNAASLLPKGRLPISGQTGILFFLHPIGPGEEADLLLPAVQTPNPEAASFSFLSNVHRLYDPQEMDVSFFLEIFLQTDHKLSHKKSVNLGPHRVFTEITKLPFRQDRGFPYGLSLVFPSTGGKEHFWVLFSSPELHSIFTFSEKADVKAYVRDIDGTGSPDLLLFEDVFEDSKGYETYITWFKWDGMSYRKHKSTNIVRNLRRFFDTAETMLSLQRWRPFLDFSLDPKMAVKNRDKDVSALLDEIFTFSPLEGILDPTESTSFSMEIGEKNVTQVVFPDVLENPFPLGPEGPESFTFTFRIAVEEEYLFFTARLGMSQNPFDEKMFYFLSD